MLAIIATINILLIVVSFSTFFHWPTKRVSKAGLMLSGFVPMSSLVPMVEVLDATRVERR